MPNQLFTVDLANISSSKGQALAAELGTKLTDLYKSSPALGRYFSEAEIHAFRNGSVIADYKLTFRLPEEEKDQLRNFTLSTEMVYNVFRQFLYDQDSPESEPMFIECDSLQMVSGR
uniref:SEA domain-containing protein n=1 Tax=Amphilophus citrinellus TaxID=61819 RepID=A0A3Q0T160_AMPCI